MPTEQLLPTGTWRWELSSSGRLLPGVGEITHLTQAFLRKGLALVVTFLMGNIISLKTSGIQVN